MSGNTSCLPSGSRDYFFFLGSGALEVWLVTNVFTRANSFWKPVVKSLVPYSNRTTKLKVKNRKRTTQKMVRSNAMADTVTYSRSTVNGAETGAKVPI